jgi:hypothetical protein
MSAAASAFGTVRQVGHHFAVVAGIPSLVVTTFFTLLVASGAPSQAPNPERAADAAQSLGLTGIGLLLVALLACGLILQPFQFAFTQLLEGYWGTSAPAVLAMRRSARRHAQRMVRLERVFDLAQRPIAVSDSALSKVRAKQDKLILRKRYSKDQAEGLDASRLAELNRSMHLRFEGLEAYRLRTKYYPEQLGDVMPTTLGNVLRRHERLAGQSYELDAVTAAGLLAQTSEPTLREYYDDARTNLDLATQTILMWTVLTVLGLVLLWPYGVWLLVPTVTAVLTVLAYRGAIETASAFGEALTVLVALGRFDLYTALHVPLPSDADFERHQNDEIMRQINGETAQLPYDHRPSN